MLNEQTQERLHAMKLFGDPTVADSILDRIVHNAYRMELNGESMRKKGRPPDGERELVVCQLRFVE
jgi:DNA replication protein DnaC